MGWAWLGLSVLWPWCGPAPHARLDGRKAVLALISPLHGGVDSTHLTA